MKVLIVDDSSVIRKHLRLLLLENKFEVIEADNGVKGIAQVESNSDIQLIISDINMPEMGGMEMLESLHAKGSKIPLVFMATESNKTDMMKAKNMGAKGWIIKPADNNVIMKIVQSIQQKTAKLK